jgi:hypothetical protein
MNRPNRAHTLPGSLIGNRSLLLSVIALHIKFEKIIANVFWKVNVPIRRIDRKSKTVYNNRVNESEIVERG